MRRVHDYIARCKSNYKCIYFTIGTEQRQELRLIVASGWESIRSAPLLSHLRQQIKQEPAERLSPTSTIGKGNENETDAASCGHRGVCRGLRHPA